MMISVICVFRESSIDPIDSTRFLCFKLKENESMNHDAFTSRAILSAFEIWVMMFSLVC